MTTKRSESCNQLNGIESSWTGLWSSCFTAWLGLTLLAVSASRLLIASALPKIRKPLSTCSNSRSSQSTNSTSEEAMQPNSVLLEVPKYLHAPDWVAFESVLRNLGKLERMPVETLTEGLYGFVALADARFTAEQLLDEIDKITANLRVMLANERAMTNKK